jgi:hypothetical protein
MKSFGCSTIIIVLFFFYTLVCKVSKTSIHPFYCVSCDFEKCFWISVCKSVHCCFSSSRLPGLFEHMLKNECVLLTNTPCSHLHSFCAAGMSSSLGTRVIVIRVPWGRLGGWHWGGYTSDFIFAVQYVIVVGLWFKWYTLYSHFEGHVKTSWFGRHLLRQLTNSEFTHLTR